MTDKFLMGNEAIAMGAIHSGLNLASGYPGTPSTEILEACGKYAGEDVYVEWSTNEKVALEVAAGASYAGARTLVTMKQVGLNVAADPIMSLAYVGVKGGMVVVVADDPGPISSQTEQDTRLFAAFSKLPILDPQSPGEAYHMMRYAYDLSEKYRTPVILRPTTRVCHGYESLTLPTNYQSHKAEGFIKDTKRWVIFPRASYLNHINLEKRREILEEEFSHLHFNQAIDNGSKIGVVGSGISFSYLTEALEGKKDFNVLKIGTTYPFPTKLCKDFLEGLDKVIVFEELNPTIEEEVLKIVGRNKLNVDVFGKLDGTCKVAGENSVEEIKNVLNKFSGKEILSEGLVAPEDNNTLDTTPTLAMPELPMRPPTLCAGCPHRASFYAVKQAMKGKEAVFNGDIGCYTLGNAMPLDMVDTCLCMGADITIAQGISRIQEDKHSFAFIGDSTFFASGIPGIINAVYNDANITIVILDNHTTAMTGNQPHPGMDSRIRGEVGSKVVIEKVLEGIGIEKIAIIDPYDQQLSIDTVKEFAQIKGVKVIIFRSPCIAVAKPTAPYYIDQNCISCNRCIKEIGCPAIAREGKKVYIEEDLCYGCGLCVSLCPTNSILQREV